MSVNFVSLREINRSNMNSSAETEIVFRAVFDWNASKTIEIFASLINIVFVSPFYFYVVWYERFGANHQRSLINQLLASVCASGVAYNVFVQTLDILVTAFGPFSFMFCHFRRLVRSSITLQVMLMTTAITVVKFVYIFVLRSPPDSNLEFWNTFICLWTLTCSFACQFVYQFLPGRNQINIYICSGSFDKALIGTPVKINQFARGVFVASVAWFIFATFKIYRKRNKTDIQTISLSVQVQQDHHRDFSAALKDIFKNSLVNTFMTAMGFVWFVPALAIPAYISSLDPEQFNSSPAAELYQFTEHGLILFGMTNFIAMCYRRNKTMRTTILREMRDDLEELKERMRDFWPFQ